MNSLLPDLIYGYDVKDIIRVIELLKEEGITAQSINKLTTPPTEQELCKALGEYMNEPVWFDENGNIRITTQWITQQIYLKGKYVGINIHVVLPPHLVEMIGKFYKGKVKE